MKIDMIKGIYEEIARFLRVFHSFQTLGESLVPRVFRHQNLLNPSNTHGATIDLNLNRTFYDMFILGSNMTEMH